ncbi:TPA: type VI secretion system Vgr family protein [Burkholderia contaminans]|uniref:Type VI secretion system tip protein VgrG n=1 Tax=Burkholderia contaminans TaxID=488447 RepID=A0AAP4R6Y4_9BURK|nr:MULTISPECIES: type VI secretion system Vgr family protein [Burkholderia]MBD1409810.1 type VI secretion system tip protein VgrG [Burkholderia contaminans]MBH9671827.1 type VI secretion system tip protein VgrG [Burkholderia contaminans]MBH9679229.1 type VI secretion system tip protein VgrG [Burkholderia contaminans]MBH9709236.1 type VI secretion system tip protein VgrG [Burkholderia contaminans]MBM6425059.1 type VI secretion system tip protein VgrG [Burkholderia contaminans]
MSTNMDVLKKLAGDWSQYDRFLWVTTPLGPNALVAESLLGWEAVDHGGYRFQLTALSGNEALPLERLIGATILIEWRAREGSDVRRPVHGHIIAAERIGYNGGLARFRLEVEPWLSVLRQRVDHYNFLNASVLDISEQIFGYHTAGAVVPAWRWALGDPARYRKRSLTTQAGESDFDFLQRLWAEEGIFYWFEHAGDAHASSLGKHTLVLADSNQSFTPDKPEVIGYHQTSDGDPAGSIQHFMTARRWRIGRVARASWDHRTLSTRLTGAQADRVAMAGEDRDVAGPYAFQTAALGDQRARQQLDAQRVAASCSEGRSTCMALHPGMRFAISGHPALRASDAFVCLRVQHRVRANVDADVHATIAQTLGDIPPMLDADVNEYGMAHALHAALGSGTHDGAPLVSNEAVYANSFVALPAAQTYRPLIEGGHGARSHPVAAVQGAQTAIVVGAGDPVHTDRDHRVRIQHHAQRGPKAASLVDHPHVANAPGDRNAGTWTRVLTPVGGDNWGGVSVPRVGQEVWTEWLEGQPDRPVVVGSLYNGQGNADAQHNAQAGGPASSTGNAAAWFAGNGHPAALTGIKTQDLKLSQQGTGGYRQFLIDDTAGEASARLYTTDHNSGLTLGHLKQIQDNQRQADRGYGIELTTDAAAALRGGSGMLVSAARDVSQMDASASREVLTQNRQLLDGLAEAARAQGAEPAQPAASVGAGQDDTDHAAGPGTLTQLAAVTGLQQSEQALAATRDGRTSAQAGGGSGSAAAWSRPHVVAHGADGLAAVTPGSQVWVSGTETVLSAGQDLQWTAKGKTTLAATHGIAFYTQGNAAGERPVAGQGIALHAASGAVCLQAQNAGTLGAAAQQAVVLSSSQGAANLQAPKRLLLNAAKAYLKMDGGNIEVGAPGRVEFKSAQRELTGPRGAGGQTSLGSSSAKDCQLRLSGAAASHDSVVMLPAG